MKTLEICTANLASVEAAAKGGADRIELCSALSADGLTPSAGMIATAREIFPNEMNVLIRPREGNFVYSPYEVECMARDIEVCRDLGADGVVIGVLTSNGDVDTKAMRRLISAAKGMSVTFHRAFDVCRNPLQALDEIISLGCNRLLTSGQAPTALKGASLIADLHERADGRILIMAGAGVTADNIAEVLRLSHADDVHGSFSVDHGSYKVSVAHAIQKAANIINSLNQYSL